MESNVKAKINLCWEVNLIYCGESNEYKKKNPKETKDYNECSESV